MKKLILLLAALVLCLGTASCKEEEAAAAAVESEGVSIEMGEVGGNTYKSDLIGIGCTLGDGWHMYTEEEIAELNGFARGDGTALGSLGAGELIYDMMASTSDGRSQINVMLEVSDEKTVSEADILKMYEGYIPDMRASYMNMGFTDFSAELTDMEFAGESCAALVITADYYDMKYYSVQITKKCGSLLAAITLSSSYEDSTESMAELFYPAK